MIRPLRAALAAAALLSALGLAHAQLVIGQTAGFTGPVAEGVKEVTQGAKLWINHDREANANIPKAPAFVE